MIALCVLSFPMRIWTQNYTNSLRMYECHINVEVVSTIKAIHYMYNCVYKGHHVCVMELKLAEGQTQAEAQESLRRNEVKHFQHCRQVAFVL